MLLLLRLIHDSQHEVHNHCEKQDDCQEGRSETVVEPSLAPHADGPCSPMICYQRVYHCQHSDTGEEEGGDEGHAVAKVEHAYGEGAEDNGEIEP